jgi:amino acid adenylation domain-containing protein
VQPAAIPTDHPRPAVQSFSGAHQTLSLTRELIAKLKRIALDENATLYMVFLAAFKMLLSRYSGREDVALGSPVANRSRPEWEDVIGTFINILVLRTDLAGNPSLREIVRRVREVVLDAFTHQEMPFHKLVEELSPDRDSSRSALVQILFNFQSTPAGQIDFDGISWTPFEIEQWASQFDLSVTIDPEITRKIFISYNTDLYDEATVARLLRQYRAVLEALAANAEQSLETLALLIAESNRDAKENRLVCPDACFHELFEAQAMLTPDSTAAVYEDRQFTYGELNERANHLAGRLRALGVGAETLVGICAERSLELVAGLLAIAKAGGAYVPIDPAYPSERAAFILKDSAVSALVTQRCLLAQLPENDLPVVFLDDVVETESEAAARVEPIAAADRLAYVIYTSGSTGRPKGVQITHRALTNFLYSMKERPGIGATDVLLSVTTISFDIAALELFLPLIMGGRVVVASRQTAADGQALARKLEACGATVMQATPTSWRMMIDAGWQGSSDFKAICGGEGLPLDLARELTSRSGSVWNLYGPTETTVWSSVWAVQPGCEKVCIGGPIHNTQIHVLDGGLRPLPIGAEGEIYLGGDGLARGYLHRPELTAEKFLPNPFGAQSSRLYRTGDWGRCLEDGSVEFIGRIDNQVKLRGYRIELGEVEAVLSAHQDVKQALAVVRGEGAEKRLVAYLIAHEGRSPTERDLGSFAKEKLPGYMVPSALVFLKTLPLTPNGKIDRRALPPPENGANDLQVVPADRLEFELTHLWTKYLKIGGVGLHDNFFDLGGDSLRATGLIAQMEKRFGKTIRLVDFLADPTPAGVVALLRQSGCATDWSFLFPIRARGSKPPFFWVHGDASNFLLPAYLKDRPLYGFMHQSQDGTPAKYTTVEKIAANYLEELCSVQPEGPYHIGGYSFGGLVAFEMAQQLRKRGEKVALLALLEATSPGPVRTDSRKQKRNSTAKIEARARLRRHLANLRTLSVTEMIAYSGATAGKLAKRLSGIDKLKRAAKRWVYRFCERSGRVMPPWVRTAYIVNVYSQAARRYDAEAYFSRVVFFKGLENAHDYESPWRRLVPGELEFHDIPGDHASILEEPQLRTWAEKLNQRLNEFEADSSTEAIEAPEPGPISQDSK